ncbi:hypothetical protein H0P51_07275 [Mycobacterium vicinigordonae]|uniref:Uncharacterized protein n=1 Tax=Mycobacterium vicinigordonae TaxID=1719132 RepID=A0A7D6I8Y2_9MYCO|nr:hypothetical protein H0P51_07275 [Mycobacterium vicinigordonae]
MTSILSASALHETTDNAEGELGEPAESNQANSRESKTSDEENAAPGGAASSVPKSDSDAQQRRRSRSVSISLRSLLISLIIVLLAIATGLTTRMYLEARSQIDVAASEAATISKAEKIALDYAVKAATMDSRDLQSWKVKLVDGTSPELKDKLTKAADSMEQILVPLQWISTAQPLAAKLRTSTAGVYIVDCFVRVQTKTVQTPDALQSTATYSVTIDANKDWKITDVGGIGAVAERK